MISKMLLSWCSDSHSASVLIFPVSNLIGIFFVMISCVEFSFWIANGIVIDCIPSVLGKKRSIKEFCFLDFIFLPSSTETCNCPDCIQLWSKFCGKLDKLSSKSFWLSNIFSLIFWFCVWINSWCLFSPSKFLWEASCEVIIDTCCCCCCCWCACCCCCWCCCWCCWSCWCASFWWFCWFWFGIKKFSSFEESSQHDSSVDVISSWNESWWF